MRLIRQNRILRQERSVGASAISGGSKYAFSMLIYSTTIPMVTNVQNGTITIDDNGDGTFTAWSGDDITHFEMDVNKADITRIRGIRTATITDMNNMFSSCAELSHFSWMNTKKVVSMENTWNGCAKLTCLSHLNTIVLINGAGAFIDCSLLNYPSPTGTPVRDGDDALAGGQWTNPDLCPLPRLEQLPGWSLFDSLPPSPTAFRNSTKTLSNTAAIPVNANYAFMRVNDGLVTDVDMQCVVLYEGNTSHYGSYILAKGLDMNNFVGITSYNNKIMLYERHGGTWHNLGIEIPVAGTLGKRIRLLTIGNQASLYVADVGDPINSGLIGTATYLAPQQAYLGLLLREHPIVGELVKDWQAAEYLPMTNVIDNDTNNVIDNDGNNVTDNK